MVIAADGSLSFIVFAMAWMLTGISPFVWISRGALHLEAARIQAWRSIGVAWMDFRSGYAGTLAVVRSMKVERGR